MRKITFLFVFLFSFMFVSSQLRISNNGNVGINNTNPAYTLDITGSFRASAVGGGVICNDGYLNPDGYVSLGQSYQRWVELYADYPTFTTSPEIDSDERFKTDISNISDVLSGISKMRSVKYKLIKEIPGKQNTYMYGFIAQEVKDIFPDIVTTRKDNTHGIRYTEMIPVLVKAIQEQQKIIDNLEERIKVLESAKK